MLSIGKTANNSSSIHTLEVGTERGSSWEARSYVTELAGMGLCSSGLIQAASSDTT